MLTSRSAIRGASASYGLCRLRRKGDTLRVGPQRNWSRILSRQLIERLRTTLPDRAHRHQHISHETRPVGDDHRTFDQDVSLVPPERGFSSTFIHRTYSGPLFSGVRMFTGVASLISRTHADVSFTKSQALQKARQTTRKSRRGSRGSIQEVRRPV